MLSVNITIQADAEGHYTAKEQDVLNALAGNSTVTTQVGSVKVTEPVQATPAKAEPEAKPAPAKRTRRTKEEIEAEKAAKAAKATKDEEPAETEDAPAEAEEPKTLQEELAEDDATEDAEEAPEDLRGAAVALATQVVGGGNPGLVRKVLQDLGAKKLSDLKDKDLGSFIKQLKASKSDA